MLGIIGAMTIEIEGLKEIMTEREEKTISGMTFTRGKLCGNDTVVTVCGEGKVNAAMCAQTMILTYAPDMIINTGVAGGLADGLKIADIVVADCVVQHDMDMSPLGHPIGYICGVDGVEIPCDKKIVDTLSDCVESFGIHHVCGVIASGDQFINSNTKKAQLITDFNAAACEMEGGAIGHVCHRNGVPFGVLRAISDGGDDSSHMSFPEFAALAAANSIKVIKLFAEQI